METKDLGKNLLQIFESRYIIPLYQRNFAWREEQIAQLLKDVYHAFKRNPEGRYYIGSLVVRKRGDEDFEVIDGQQRLTVLCLITKLLGINLKQHLTYDSRPHVEEFLNVFYARPQSVDEFHHPTVTYLKEAIRIIETTPLCEESETDRILTIYDETICNSFAEYFAQHVILVRVEIPEDTDVASYFEIMNNRGEQLQEHEILKALMIERIKETDGIHYDVAKQKEFALIWEACSQIDEPIQKLFSVQRRRSYFGDSFDEFHFRGLTSGEKSVHASGYTLDDIIHNRHTYPSRQASEQTEDSIEFTDEAKYASIIDFPNFIMHIFKAFYNEVYQEECLKKRGKSEMRDVPLDARYMLDVYDTIKDRLNPEIFIEQLFRSKTFFDRYVIKTIVTEEDQEEDHLSWSLQKVRYNDQKMYFVGTFDEENLQKRAVKLLSMLQVTFRTAKYKNWLQEAIHWFATQEEIHTVQPQAYIRLLDAYILRHYQTWEQNLGFDLRPIAPEESLSKENSLSLGVHTPHFLFTFIDYLYWVESRNTSHRTHGLKLHFDFKYWNSVEHHLARKKAEEMVGHEDFIDNLGNLCLLSRSSNSRLNDRLVEEKVRSYKDTNMGANRSIMYKMTEERNYQWDQQAIKEHYNELVDLLSQRAAILNR